jgi:hypothetical protein
VKSVRYHEEARAEFLHEVRYDSAICPSLGERFDRAVQAAEVRAAEAPALGSPYQHGTRRVLLDRFKFSLVHVESEGEIVVLAIAPFRRKPGYWKGRLGKV